jgi:hypothetical protein
MDRKRRYCEEVSVVAIHGPFCTFGKAQMIETVAAAVDKKELPAMEPDATSSA